MISIAAIGNTCVTERRADVTLPGDDMEMSKHVGV